MMSQLHHFVKQVGFKKHEHSTVERGESQPLTLSEFLPQ